MPRAGSGRRALRRARSPPLREPRREPKWKASAADRILGGADVVVGPKPGGCAPVGVEDDVARAGVAVARLADRSGVHDERPLGMGQRRAGRDGAPDQLAVLVSPQELYMAVADEAHRPPLSLQAEGGRARVDDVLPHRVADAAVKHLHALALAARHPGAERRDLVLPEDGARPL